MSDIEQLTERIKRVKSVMKAQRGTRKHNPFKYNPHRGKGPLDREDDEKKNWKCRCKDYHVVCQGMGPEVRGQRLEFDIDRNYKKWYNQLYKRWRRNKERG
jgi:hypothetical protein